MKQFRHFCPVYRIPIILFIGGTSFEAATEISRIFKTDKPDPKDFSEQSAGSVIEYTTERVIAFWFPGKDVTMGTIAHEAIHAALLVFSKSGVASPNWGSDEHFTYYVGWLVDLLCEKLTPIKPTKPPRGAKVGGWY